MDYLSQQWRCVPPKKTRQADIRNTETLRFVQRTVRPHLDLSGCPGSCHYCDPLPGPPLFHISVVCWGTSVALVPLYSAEPIALQITLTSTRRFALTPAVLESTRAITIVPMQPPKRSEIRWFLRTHLRPTAPPLILPQATPVLETQSYQHVRPLKSGASPHGRSVIQIMVHKLSPTTACIPSTRGPAATSLGSTASKAEIQHWQRTPTIEAVPFDCGSTESGGTRSNTSASKAAHPRRQGKR